MKYKFRDYKDDIIIKKFKDDDELTSHLIEYGHLYEDFEEIEEEIDPSRLWSYIESPTLDFAIISAERKSRSNKENEAMTNQLKKDIKHLGYWYTELNGGYIEVNDDGKRVDSDTPEKSFIIPKITKEDAIKLGMKYSQDSVLFKDSKNHQMGYIITNKRNGKIGDYDFEFNMGAGADNFVADKGTKYDFYSQLIKSKYPDLKLSFIPKGQTRADL